MMKVLLLHLHLALLLNFPTKGIALTITTETTTITTSSRKFLAYEYLPTKASRRSDTKTTSLNVINQAEVNECNVNNDSHLTKEEEQNLMETYLQRIGFSLDENNGMLFSLQQEDGVEEKTIYLKDFKPTEKNLQMLYTQHLRHVPFENMDQHSHPPPLIVDAESDIVPIIDGESIASNAKHIPRKTESNLPSLNLYKSLRKIIKLNRGGFCYELNLSFCWLLRQLGFQARLAVADVGCKQEIPAHVVVLVDDVLHTSTKNNSNENDTNTSNRGTFLVDVGFGCPGVCDIILPLKCNQIYKDHHDDFFRFDNDQSQYPLHEGRFDTVLYRTRVDTPNEESPMYRFNSRDDMDNDAEEFQKGLEYVLNTSPTFNGKRLCVRSTENGHVTLGSDYVKWVERWETVKEEAIADEETWRAALFQHFGVQLLEE